MSTAPESNPWRRRFTAPPGRRTWSMLLAVAVIALPAAVLRTLCVGRACDRPDVATADVPFCSLPDDVRRQIAAGFREGRSPDVLAVTAETAVVDGPEGNRWPSVGAGEALVPLLFSGAGVDPEASLPADTGLDDVAPTIASVIGLRRPHPDVRSGTAVDGVASGDPPRLVVEVVLSGVGTADVEDAARWQELHALMEEGAATPGAEVGSVPLDPAAVLTTIGTGGLPSQHGITGTLVRNDTGKLVRAWGRGAPVSVIAALADDLDELNRQRPRIGLVATDRGDRGLIGGNWYVGVDRDDMTVAKTPRGAVAAARRLLGSGSADVAVTDQFGVPAYGGDDMPDLLAVVIEGAADGADAAVGRLVELANRTARGSVAVVVTATGRASTGESALRASTVARQIEQRLGEPRVVEGVASGGLFLDQEVLADKQIPEDEVVTALSGLRAAGRDVMADVFPAIAVSFARYC